MSTATPTSSSPSRRYVDYDEFIDYQVQKTRAGIKSNDLLTALIGAAVVVLAYVLVFAAFDHWVIEGGFGRGTRSGLLAALLTGLTVWFLWKLAVPYFRRVNALYAAREIEDTEPEFHGTLLTLIDLKEAGRPVSPELRAVLEKRAGISLTHMDIEQAVDRRLLMRLSYVLLGLVVITCLYTVFSPKKLSNSLWRSLLPTSSVAADTRTRIEQVQPGDVDVLARSQLEVTAELSGQMPDDVMLLYSTQDGRLVDERIVMRETEDGLRAFRGVITGENARGILQNLSYRIIAGDAASDTYSVTVTQPPSATVDEVQYEFPAYMATRGRTQTGGAIDAWEGTWVTIRATANMPVESAIVKFSDADDLTQRAEELPVDIAEGTQLTARWQLRIRSDGTYPHFYRIQCRNDAGKTDPSPALYPVKIRPDQPPQIQLVQPQSDIERPANAIVPLLYAAQDPDFLLRSVILGLERNGESLRPWPRLFEGPPDRKSLTGSYDLDLSELDLQAGDTLTYWLEARDNMEPFADRAGNRSNTPKLNITIAEPAPPEDVQQQLEEDRKQIEERLDEAKQQPSENGGELPPAADPDDPEDAPPTPPADAPAPEEPAAESAPQDKSQQGGQPHGESQPQPGSAASESADSQQGGHPNAPAAGTGSQQQQREQPSESDDGREGEAPFDDLLKELMQREQQQAEPREDAGSPGDQQSEGQQQQQEHQSEPSEKQQHSPAADAAQPSGNENQQGDPQQGGSGKQTSPTGDDAPAAPNPSPGDGTGPPSTPGGEPSPADPTHPARPGDANSNQPQVTPPGDAKTNPPQPGDGTEPSSTAENPTVRQDGTDQTDSTDRGQPRQDDTTSTPSKESPSDQTDPSNGKPQNPNASERGSQKTPGEAPPPNAEPTPSNNPDAPGSPEQLPRPDSPPQPPRGENSGSQESPGGQPPSGQPGTGNTSKQPGQPTPSQPDGGQPNSSQPQGGQQTPQSPTGSNQPSPGGDSSPQGAEPPTGRSPSPPNGNGEQAPQPGDPSTGGQGDSPSDGEPPSGGPQPGGRDAPKSDQPAGSQPPQGGQPDAEGQQPPASPGQPQGQPGQGTQPSQPGGAPQPGQPGGPGSQPQGSSTGNEGGGSNFGTGSDAPVPGGGPNGDQQPGNGAGEGEPAAADDIQGDDPDLEHKRKAAELVLQRLEEQLQRGEIDPKLREEYGVTEEQMRDFTERLRQRLADTGEDQSPEAEARRRQFQETLRSFDFNSTGTERAGGDGPREASGGFSGSQRTAPLKLRDATRAFREKLSRQRPAAN